MQFKRFLLATTLIAATAGNTGATGLKSLEEFVKTVKTGQADFTQVVTSPAKDGRVPRVKKSSGQFEFSRPSRFKFTYVKPFAQTIVADGQTLWLYDQDLNQVTARLQSQVLGSTPAALIASAADLKALQADFALADAPDKDGLEWVVATPTATDGQLQTVRVGLKASANGAPTLEVLEILDSFGQRSVLSFSGFQVNPALPANAFDFKPPVGADILRQ
ncbi:outer membrane lipoprotein chaperone LolA [Rhodoferax antarcticus]|uniref:outer membrane lipoprotein chaperone LolA n=1 Tax=Rhodoferax antarcticus TaxID=81479 RepID=UPI0022245D96|nr:outer membrane lipoprotein chaperone LolA [Rhodoferax antarcticus]MCW2311550.1 outer membrane lipoprotein carrier protein [Rhodoferax antarcticus]